MGAKDKDEVIDHLKRVSSRAVLEDRGLLIAPIRLRRASVSASLEVGSPKEHKIAFNRKYQHYSELTCI